ncbi:MAG: calcium-binding protein, partial [Pseudomonadota bacterium]
MSNTTQYYDLASLAEASYVLYHIDGLDFSNEDQVKAALQNEQLYHGHFSATQAADFVEKWEVVSHQKNTESGFSATLFKNKETGEFFYANRGTEPGQVLDDLVITDGGDIVTDGLAINQIVDMYNDWQRIQSTGVYQAAKLDLKLEETALLEAERLATPFGVVGAYQLYLRTRNDVIIDMPSGFVYTIDMVASDQLFTDERATGAGINISGGVTAVGHSLGGHLATAFSRLFSECSDVLTINGAGFMTGALGGLSGNAATNIRNLFAMLGGASSFDSSEMLNLYGEKWLEFTTMNNSVALGQQGGHQEIYIESASLLGTTAGHGKEQMTDALAVYDLFISLDQRFQTEDFQAVFDELTPIFETMATGRDELATYENIVNIFGELFVDNFQAISGSQLGSREDLYKAIKDIKDGISDKNLNITSLAKRSESEITSLAEAQGDSGLATRYALVNLNPFTITGEPGLYDRFNKNGELDIHSASNEDGDLSEKYIEDRAKFLYYLAHSDATVSNLDPDIDFIDNRLGISLEVDNGMTGLDADSQYLFGNLEGEFLGGGSAVDHLYGMDGDDTLNGGGGADYLEGGKGQDTMDGGDGKDTFFIMGEDTDFDIFTGGADEDTILGGASDDTIRVHDFQGENTVEIIDGGGGTNIIAGTNASDTIDLNGTTLSGIARIEGGTDEDIIKGSKGADV